MADDGADAVTTAGTEPVARLSPEYSYDVYVSYYQAEAKTVSVDIGSPLEWTRAAIEDLRQTLAAVQPNLPPARFYHQVRDDRAGGPLSEGDRTALAASAVMLVIVTPDYCTSPRAQEELAVFIAKLKAQGGGSRQLLCCDLIPVDETLSAKLPWRNGGLTGVDNLLGPPLYDDLAQLPIRDLPLRAELLKQLAADVDSRLSKLHRICRAVEAVQPLVPSASGEPEEDDTAIPEQVYMLDCKNTERWDLSHQQLSEKLWVNPDTRQIDPADTFSMAKQQERRRSYLINCAGLVMLRSAQDEDLHFLFSTSIADRSDMQRAKRPLQCVLVDWEGAPPPQFPKFFKFDHVDPKKDGWVDEVVLIMRRKAPAAATSP